MRAARRPSTVGGNLALLPPLLQDPETLGTSEDLVLAQSSNELLHEKRVAGRPLDHPWNEARRRRPLENLVHQPADADLVEWLELNLPRPREEFVESRLRFGPRGEVQDEGTRLAQSSELASQVEARRIGPVRILEHQDERLFGCDVQEPRRKALMEAAPERFGLEGRHLVVSGRRQSEESREVGNGSR